MGKKMGRPKSENPKNVELGVSLDAGLAEALTRYCSENGISKGEAVRRGLKLLIGADEK